MRQGKDRRKPRSSRKWIVVPFGVALIAAFAQWGDTWFEARLARGASAETAAEDQPPTLEITRVGWEGRDGIEVWGYAEHLRDGDLIWTYHQPPGEEGIYPHPGPCPVDDNGTFYCALGNAPDRSPNRTFKVFAAVVTESQANAAASAKTKDNPFPDVDQVPRVDSDAIAWENLES